VPEAGIKSGTKASSEAPKAQTSWAAILFLSYRFPEFRGRSIPRPMDLWR
jgi:hypothetical protein